MPITWNQAEADRVIHQEQPFKEQECNQYFDDITTNYTDRNISIVMNAAKQGDTEAQLELAKRYEQGNGVPKSDREAVEWIVEAAHQHNALAQVYLGACYSDGHVVPQDDNQAFKWFFASAEQGCADAQCMLGLCYTAGIGTTENEEEALKWYTKAAEQNYSVAQFELGWYYEDVVQDYVLAVDWYSKAANQGDKDAQYALGLCYYNGKGVRIDYDRAFGLIKQAAAQGNEEAIKFAKKHNL